MLTVVMDGEWLSTVQSVSLSAMDKPLLLR